MVFMWDQDDYCTKPSGSRRSPSPEPAPENGPSTPPSRHPWVLYFNNCDVCGSPTCQHAHRWYTRAGFVGEMSEDVGDVRAIEMAERVYDYFPIRQCQICLQEDCSHPHRLWTREGMMRRIVRQMGPGSEFTALAQTESIYGPSPGGRRGDSPPPRSRMPGQGQSYSVPGYIVNPSQGQPYTIPGYTVYNANPNTRFQTPGQGYPPSYSVQYPPPSSYNVRHADPSDRYRRGWEDGLRGPDGRFQTSETFSSFNPTYEDIHNIAQGASRPHPSSTYPDPGFAQMRDMFSRMFPNTSSSSSNRRGGYS